MGRPSPPGNEKVYDPSIPCHGFVIAPDRAIKEVEEEIRRTGKIPGKDVFLFKEGMLGALSDEQDENPRICDPSLVVLEPTPPKLQHRLDLMRGLKERRIVCIPELDRTRMVYYLRKRAVETPDDEERVVIEKVISDLKEIPLCSE